MSAAVRRTLACLPGEYGPNLAVMAARGFERRPLPVDGADRAAAAADVAARVGLSVALGEYLAAVPQAVRTRLAELGGLTRDVLAQVPGWRVV